LSRVRVRALSSEIENENVYEYDRRQRTASNDVIVASD